MVMKSRRGMSDVVSTTLLVLVTLAAVSIIGAFIFRSVDNSTSNIETTTACQNLELEVVKCEYTFSSPNYIPSKILVKREAKGSDLSLKGLKFVFTDILEGTVIKDASSAPIALETKSYSSTELGTLTSPPAKVNVVAVILDSKGKESLCSASKEVACAIPAGATPSANSPPLVSITSPVNNFGYDNIPAIIDITATAADADGTISKVEFYDGATKLGEDITGPSPYTWQFSTRAETAHSLTAVATDNLGAKTTSAPVVVTVVN